jgi:hypothetical protein
MWSPNAVGGRGIAGDLSPYLTYGYGHKKTIKTILANDPEPFQWNRCKIRTEGKQFYAGDILTHIVELLWTKS